MANKRQQKKNAKKSQIRGIDQTQKDEFNRLRKNVQSKLSRWRRENVNEIVTMNTERNKKGKIEKVEYKFVKPEYFIRTPKWGEIKTKKELNEWMDKARKFTDRGYKRYQLTKNDVGLVITKQVEERADKNSDIAIESAEKLIESKKGMVIAGGRTTLGERLEMQKDDDVGGIRVPKSFDLDKISSKRRLIEKLENLEKRRGKAQYFEWRNSIYKENFMDVLKQAFNSDANDVIKFLESMDNGDFFDMSLKYPEMSIDNYYGRFNQIIGEDEDLEKVRGYLTDYQNGLEDFDLKNFPNG